MFSDQRENKSWSKYSFSTLQHENIIVIFPDGGASKAIVIFYRKRGNEYKSIFVLKSL
jgi:hypothetical protein